MKKNSSKNSTASKNPAEWSLNLAKRSLSSAKWPLVLTLIISLLAVWHLSAEETNTSDAPGIVDIHTHVACLSELNNCYISPALRKSWKFPLYLRAMGVSVADLERFGDGIVVERLSAKLKGSKRVAKAVALALDGVITPDGQNLDRERTEVFIPNEFVLREIRKHDNLLFGASINPHRFDAIERLEWAKENGAVLVKWIPSIMGINPADNRIIPFYQKMKELNIPLLVHAGDEHSFTKAEDELCDPVLLELPLSLGVRVIASHLASLGENEGEANYQRLIGLFEKYPNLYADISALTQFNRRGTLAEAIKNNTFTDRLVYGTDWPLQFFPLVSVWWHVRHIGTKNAFKIRKIKNPWDKDVALKQALGVPDSVFQRTGQVLGLE